MAAKGYRHKYEVAEFFGVTPQALSSWLTTGNIPSKHILRYQSEIQPTPFSSTTAQEPSERSAEDQQTVIDYLINENVILKNTIAQCKQDIANLRTVSGKNDLIEKINSESLFMSGRISDGTILSANGNWKKLMGYSQKELVGHRYDHEDIIHPEEFERTKKHQQILRESTGIKETRYSTIQRWKHGKTGEYVLLSMVCYANIEQDRIDIVAKPIDSFLSSGEQSLN